MTLFIKSLLKKCHLVFAKNRVLVIAALRIRNQLNMVISYYVGGTSNSITNGENFLIKALGTRIKFFCDVGANVGDWSQECLAHSPNAHGVLFEPSLDCVEQLILRYKSSNITIHQTAVSNYIGKASFQQQENCGTGSSFSNGYINKDKSIETQVNVLTLDYAFTNNNQLINFLKIDTEGYDMFVLEGAKTLLENKRIEIIQFEYNSLWEYSGRTLSIALNFLQSFSFKVFILRKDGLYDFPISVWGTDINYANFVAIRTDLIVMHQELIKGKF